MIGIFFAGRQADVSVSFAVPTKRLSEFASAGIRSSRFVARQRPSSRAPRDWRIYVIGACVLGAVARGVATVTRDDGAHAC